MGGWDTRGGCLDFRWGWWTCELVLKLQEGGIEYRGCDRERGYPDRV